MSFLFFMYVFRKFVSVLYAKTDITISRYHPYSKFFIEIKNKSAYPMNMARKNLSTKIENDLQKEIKKLAIDLERPLNNLLEEAIQDILKKYEKVKK
jgi:hypothetical protein